ncbi:MAG TPA: hypothetical protein VKE26_08295 [Xanthobacteraceae bacterium]|nr:hypothetical protein [Xanthobacteraceae bacterium]
MTERSRRREAREQRLQAALRENLKRRKAQARGREDASDRSASERDAPPVPPAGAKSEDES